MAERESAWSDLLPCLFDGSRNSHDDLVGLGARFLGVLAANHAWRVQGRKEIWRMAGSDFQGGFLQEK